jgi:type II secretory pathway pseudopilin PulG
MTWWNNLCQVVGDFLLGWSLALHSDATLSIVALVSAAVFTVIRWATANQDRLRRAAADRKQLKRLIREAKGRNDRDALARYRITLGMIRRMSLISEIVPTFVAIVAIAVFVSWAARRLEFHPPRGGEPIWLEVITPVASAGQFIHLVPEEGIASDGWIKQIALADEPGGRRGMAAWNLTANRRETPYRLTVRYGRQNLQHELLVGSRRYSPAIVQHSREVTSRLRYEPVQLFGWVPGLPAIGIPAWLAAYLLLTCPLTFLLRFLLRFARV